MEKNKSIGAHIKKIPINKKPRNETIEKINRNGGTLIKHRLKSDYKKGITYRYHPDTIAAIKRLKERFCNEPLYVIINLALIFAERELAAKGLTAEIDLELELGL